MLVLVAFACLWKLSQLDNIKVFKFLPETYAGLVQTLHKKCIFLLKISSVNVTNLQFPVDLVAFADETLNGKLDFYAVKTQSVASSLYFEAREVQVKLRCIFQHFLHVLFNFAFCHGREPSFIFFICCTSLWCNLNPIQVWARGQKSLPTSFSLVTATNVGIKLWLLILTFLPHWFKISRPYLELVPNYWT